MSLVHLVYSLKADIPAAQYSGFYPWNVQTRPENLLLYTTSDVSVISANAPMYSFKQASTAFQFTLLLPLKRRSLIITMPWLAAFFMAPTSPSQTPSQTATDPSPSGRAPAVQAASAGCRQSTERPSPLFSAPSAHHNKACRSLPGPAGTPL